MVATCRACEQDTDPCICCGMPKQGVGRASSVRRHPYYCCILLYTRYVYVCVYPPSTGAIMYSIKRIIQFGNESRPIHTRACRLAALQRLRPCGQIIDFHLIDGLELAFQGRWIPAFVVSMKLMLPSVSRTVCMFPAGLDLCCTYGSCTRSHNGKLGSI